MKFLLSMLSLTTLSALSPATCGGSGGDPVPADMSAGKALWYKTCGDVVCRGYTAPMGVSRCTTEKLGDSCTSVGQQCDPMDSCNALYRCATSDPTMQAGGCPISRQKYKTAINYLDEDGRQRFADELQRIKLATYRYKTGGPTRLGFIIEDQEQSVSVDADRDRVDLYGYMSLAVAALQVQEQKIQALQKELSDLKNGLVRPAARVRRR